MLETKPALADRFRRNLELTRVGDINLTVIDSLKALEQDIYRREFDLVFVDLRANDANSNEIASTILTLPPALVKKCVLHSSESVLALNMYGINRIQKIRKVASPVVLTQILHMASSR